MAWFGETFGDGLTNLKGQISKITKDVLSDDPLSTTSFEGRISELEKACEEKESEIERLKTENARLRESKSFELTEDQIQNLCQLENKIYEITAERDALNKSIDELDVEHQRELEVIINDRDLLKKLLTEQTAEGTDLSNVEELKSALKKMELERDMLCQEIKEKDHKIEECQNKLKEISTTNIRILEKIEEYKKLQSEYLQLRDENSIQNVEYNNAVEELRNLQSVLEQENIAREKMEGKNQLLQNEIDSLRQELKLMPADGAQEKVDINKLHNILSLLNVNVGNQKVNSEDNTIESLSDIEKQISILVEENKMLKEETNNLIAMKLNVECIDTLKLENSETLNKLKEIENSNKHYTHLHGEQLMVIDALKNENQKLLEKLEKAMSDAIENNKNCEMLVKERNQLETEITDLKNTNVDSKEPTAEWMILLNEQLNILHTKLGTNSSESSDAVQSLQMANERLTRLLTEQQERSTMVDSTLTHEITQLKGLVNRIRREFMQTDESSQGDRSNCNEQPSGDGLLSQSQTDDVKRLKQDVAQMTEVIKMIDHGLTLIHQDKSRLEKEASALRTMCNKTDVELSSVVKQKEQLLIEKQQYIDLLNEKEFEKENWIRLKNDEEREQNLILSEKNKLADEVVKLLEYKEKADNNMRLLQEQLKECGNEKDNLMTLEQKTAEIDALQKMLTAKGNEVEMLNGELTRQQSEFNEMKKIIIDAQQQESRFSEIEIEWNNLKVRNGELELLVSGDAQVRERISGELTSEMKRSEGLQDIVNRLQSENSDLKTLVQQLRESISEMNSPKDEGNMNNNLQVASQNVEENNAQLQQEQARYRLLQSQHDALVEKNTSLQREVQRLREHLVEVEEHYTAEALEAERAMGEYRSKLGTAEEQLRTSSTVYKSANVRSTQHVESLQSQIRLMGVQRDDLQAKLSTAEDQVQKHAAALSSLQMVLEQFQLDKEREIQANATKHDYQLLLARKRAEELENEISGMKEQLIEAKNGLKAASRLGEQLEKKTERIVQLEEQLKKGQNDLLDLQRENTKVNQSVAGKIDKFLVKNLVMGYISAAQGDRKAQALKILASVLELTEGEKSKIGVDGQGSWFSNLLHPKAEPTGESLSQAFIRFLESESRPQPQLQLLPQSSTDTTPVGAKRPPLVLTDLVLPSVTQTHVSETSESVLKDVLKDS